MDLHRDGRLWRAWSLYCIDGFAANHLLIYDEKRLTSQSGLESSDSGAEILSTALQVGCYRPPVNLRKPFPAS